MPNRPRARAALTLFIALATTIIAVGIVYSRPTLADSPSTASGWLEGTVLTDSGATVMTPFGGDGVTVHGVRRGGGTFDERADRGMGGLYAAQNITPGTYDLSVAESRGPYRPTRIFGVVVAAGQRTVLNIALQPGEALDERGSPGVRTVTLTSSGDDIDKLHTEIASLSDRVTALEARLPK